MAMHTSTWSCHVKSYLMTWSPRQKQEELPDGCARDAWERLTSEHDLTEGEDKITLLTMFQQNQLEDVRTNITVWLTSLAIQANKLKKLHHVLDEEYQIMHILASLPREYSSVVEQVKIDRRTSSALITMDEVKKGLRSATCSSRGNMVGLRMRWP